MPDPQPPTHGSCQCGAIQFEATPPSRFCAHCHCNNCRRAHGAAFVTWAGYPSNQFRITKGSNDLTRYKTTTGATRTFCKNCGSTLLFESPRWAGEVHIALANMEDTIDRPPEAHSYVDHKADWWPITDELPQYGGKSGNEPKHP